MVIVEAEDTDKIQLVLNGVSISSSQSAALYVRSADKVYVTTVSGTENSLEHSGTYTAIDENNIDAAVFSKSDLTFNGEGMLTVTAQEGHGIVSKDDLVLTSGTYVITSASHGISGKDTASDSQEEPLSAREMTTLSDSSYPTSLSRSENISAVSISVTPLFTAEEDSVLCSVFC